MHDVTNYGSIKISIPVNPETDAASKHIGSSERDGGGQVKKIPLIQDALDEGEVRTMETWLMSS